MSLSHQDLCSLGVKWLRRPASQQGPGCNVAASECMELGWRRDYSAWRHTHNVDRETALLVRLLARIGDVEALQRSLKLARNQLAQAQKVIDQQEAELRTSLTQYWDLRQEFDNAMVSRPKFAAPTSNMQR